MYEEEIFNRNGKAYWWSPDGKQIAFLRFDDAPVQRFNIVNLSPACAALLETYPYPKAGRPQPAREDRRRRPRTAANRCSSTWASTSREDIVICRVGWMPGLEDRRSRTSRTARRRGSTSWSGILPTRSRRCCSARRPRRGSTTPASRGSCADGSFLFLSERSGWKHLYHYAADGKLLAQVTDGEWEVKDVLRVDEDEKQVYFTATMTSPTGTRPVPRDARRQKRNCFRRRGRRTA